MIGEWSWQTFSIVFARFCRAAVYVIAFMGHLLYMYRILYVLWMQMSIIIYNPTKLCTGFGPWNSPHR
jgi:hypothetical protein